MQGTCQEVEVCLIIQEGYGLTFMPTEGSYSHCITGSFGPPLSAYCPTCVEKLIKFQQSGGVRGT